MHEFAATDNKRLKLKLDEAEIKLEVEKRLGPHLDATTKENEKLKQDVEGQKVTLEEVQATFSQYQAAHVAGASVVSECVTRVFQPFGLPPPPPPIDLESCTIK